MKSPPFQAIVILAVVLAGCERDRFVVEITPDGDGFQRTLTCWHEKVEGNSAKVTSLADEELQRLGQLYQRRETPAGIAKQVFSGRFTGPTPADVGGAGSYTHVATPLGTLSAYVERFRGNDDLEAELAKRRAAADQLADLVIGWSGAELGDGPDVDRLRHFLDTDLRQDLKNLAVYSWTSDAVSGDRQAANEFPVRMAQYLYERGYLALNDVPGIVRAINSNDPRFLLATVERFLARKMGIADDRPIPECLAVLGDPERLEKSWTDYLQTTDLYRQRLERWEEEKKTDPEAKQPATGDVVGELVGDAFFKFELFASPDALELKLSCGEEPFSTNGHWEAAGGAVTWSVDLGEHPALPAVCFAFWTRPERAVQQKHFGRVVLAGQGLAEYAVWYRGLSADEVRQWDAFVAGCTPEGDLKGALEAFRFPTGPAELADTPKRLILKGLEEGEKGG